MSMSLDDGALATLVAKDEIRELARLYSRLVDRKDIELLRTFYTEDATDHHATSFRGGAADYIEFLGKDASYQALTSRLFARFKILTVRLPARLRRIRPGASRAHVLRA